LVIADLRLLNDWQSIAPSAIESAINQQSISNQQSEISNLTVE